MPSAPPFNDSAVVNINYRQAHSVSGSDTNLTDQFRQGIELRDNFYFLGAVKIHSGFPQHELAQNKFGQARPALVDENWYYDLDTYGPDTFLRSNPLTDGALRSCESVFPKANRNLPLAYESSMDGVLEPIVIRSRVNFYDSEDYKDSRNIFADTSTTHNVFELDNTKTIDAFSDSLESIRFKSINGEISIDGTTGEISNQNLNYASASNLSLGVYRIHLSQSFSSIKTSTFFISGANGFVVNRGETDTTNRRYVDFLITSGGVASIPSSNHVVRTVLIFEKKSLKTQAVGKPWKDDQIYSSSNTAFLWGSGSLSVSNRYARMDNDLRSVVLSLTGIVRSDEYVSPSRKSMPSGFSFDTAEGTDSIAFGGYYYISSSVSRPPTA